MVSCVAILFKSSVINIDAYNIRMSVGIKSGQVSPVRRSVTAMAVKKSLLRRKRLMDMKRWVIMQMKLRVQVTQKAHGSDNSQLFFEDRNDRVFN